MKRTLQLTIALTVMAFTTAALAADVEANWKKNCASCHGKDGKGQTMMGKRSGAKDYTDPKVQKSFTDEQAFKAIKEGIKKDGKTKMKPYSSKLKDDEIKALIKKVRAFKKS